MPLLLKNKSKILGMNARNLQYIRPANKKTAVNLANDKLKSKQALTRVGLPVADLYGTIRNRKELLTFDWLSLPPSFALKPNRGLGGEGILIIFGRKKGQEEIWIASSDEEVNVKDLIAHTSNVLDGNFSLSGIPDVAFFEERLKIHPDLKKISRQGIPDIRIIVFNNVPIIAMLRLPTKESHGKANLHQGGIGVGIDLATGLTTFATQNDKLIEKHPDTNISLKDFPIPNWDDILKIAIQASQTIGLGYSGIDMVIDRSKGPVILEVNGHPGLSIQNANLIPLKERLNRVSGLEITSPQKGIKVAKELFAQNSKVSQLDEEDVKKVLGFIESVTVILPDDRKETIRAKIDTGIVSTTINRQLAAKLGFEKVIKNFDDLISQEKIAAADIKKVEDELNEKNNPQFSGINNIVGVKKEDHYILRPKINLSFLLKGQLVQTEVAIGHNEELSYPLVIGRHDLKQFLIDPAKTLTK